MRNAAIVSSRSKPSPRRGAAGAPLVGEPGAAAWKIDLLIAVLLIVIPVAVLWPLCGAHFLIWDDYATIAQNPYLNPPTWQSMGWYWQHPFMQLYVPVTYMVWGTLALLARQDHGPFDFGLDPAVFHTANLLLHIVVVFFVWILLRRLLDLRKERPVKASCAAAIGALIFAVHPLQVETVGWASGLKDVLYTLLSLAALWCYTEFARRSSGDSAKSEARGGRWMFYGVGVACLILSMLSKPSAMVTPAIALIVDALIVRRSWISALRDLSPWFALSLMCMIAAKHFQPATLELAATPIYLRPLVAADSLAFYIVKLLLPIRLGIDYGRNPATVIGHGWVYYTWLLPAAVAAAAVFLRRRFRLAAVGLLIFLVAILPMLGWTRFDFQRFSTVADHYVYLPMLGLALAAAALSLAAMRRFSAISVAAIAAVVILGLGAVACWQTFVWHDNFTLLGQALEVNPKSGLSHNDLATVYLNVSDTKRAQSILKWRNGDPAGAQELALQSGTALDHALTDARKATELRPGHDSYGTLAAILTRRHDWPDATAAYQQVLTYAPDDAQVIGQLGTCLAQSGNLTEAAQMLQKAIDINPDYEPAYKDLAVLRYGQHDLPAAVRELEMAVKLVPQDAQARQYLEKVLGELASQQRKQ